MYESFYYFEIGRQSTFPMSISSVTLLSPMHGTQSFDGADYYLGEDTT